MAKRTILYGADCGECLDPVFVARHVYNRAMGDNGAFELVFCAECNDGESNGYDADDARLKMLKTLKDGVMRAELLRA